jgi:hypothetical protein
MAGEYDCEPPDLKALRADLRHRFESVVEPDTKTCLDILDRVIHSDDDNELT